MIYVYQNAAGERREIQASMKRPPPERIVFNSDGSWLPAHEDAETPNIMTRVYLPPQIDSGRVRSKYPFVSNTLPHKIAGCRTDKFGRTIVESKAHEDRICKKYGFIKGF